MSVEKDFFISYNKDDKMWAKWIAGTLEENGYTTLIQAWDFRPGNNFVLEMQHALKICKRSIVVLSQSYLDSDYCQPEWVAMFIKDPLGKKKSLIPVRISNIEPEGLLSGIIYIDLFNVENEESAVKKLLYGVDIKENPRKKPVFPVGKGSLSYPGNNLVQSINYLDSNTNRNLVVDLSTFDDLCTIKIDNGNDIFQYINRNIEILITAEKWTQIQLLINELISNVFSHNSAKECFIELSNSSITIIDNGISFNPVTELTFQNNSMNRNMGALVFQNFCNKYSEEVDVTYERVNDTNRLSISFRGKTMFKIEGICTLRVTSEGVCRCTTNDIILPMGICKNYYFDIWSEDRKYGIALSFLRMAIETILSLIPESSKLIVFDSSKELGEYKKFFERYSQVIYRD